MKIAIIGSRGIPNRYGGFEQFAEYLAVELAKQGFNIWVYCSSSHDYKKSEYKGVNLVHCFDPENTIGTIGQFVYDLFCILDTRRRNFDVILQLGYTSNSIWHKLLPKKTTIITNMDGLEWSRSKYSNKVKKFLKCAEKLAVKSSDVLIADSTAIQAYLKNSYGTDSVFIPYGAKTPDGIPDKERLKELNLNPDEYFLLIARMQPDNHVEEAIKGVLQANTRHPLIVVGNVGNKFGKYLTEKYSSERIRFVGAIFDSELLDILRYYCGLYFHGHSAGGTNPSLLEAMAASAPICAHDNPFNKAVLEENALWFKTGEEIINAINVPHNKKWWDEVKRANLHKIQTKYRWENIIEEYRKVLVHRND